MHQLEIKVLNIITDARCNHEVYSETGFICVAGLPQFFQNEPYQKLWMSLTFYCIRNK